MAADHLSLQGHTIDIEAVESDLPAIFDMDIGSDPDDTCVAVMILKAPARFRPVLLITNDETVAQGRARFLAGLVQVAGVQVPVAAGLPSQRRRQKCLVEEAPLIPDSTPLDTDGIQTLIQTLRIHPRVRYFSLGALTNLDAALAQVPDLADRVELVQMGPALTGAYRRESPQYNARIDPAAFHRVLCQVRKPRLVPSHSTWGRYGDGLRQQLGIYPDDPFAAALRSAGELPTLFVRHLEAWVQTGKPCSIMHDPLTVLSSLMPGLVTFADVEMLLDTGGFAGLSPCSQHALQSHAGGVGCVAGKDLALPTAAAATTIACRMSFDVNLEAARMAIAMAVLGEFGVQIAVEWGKFNGSRTE